MPGGAPPLVFIHAFGCARSDWKAQLVRFAPQHSCIAVDLGGHGETPLRPEHRTVEAHGQDIVTLMTSLDLPPAVVVGNSLGCRVALDVVGRAPDRVCGLILVDGSRLSPTGGTKHAALGAGADPARYQETARRMFATMFSPAFDPTRISEMTARALQIDPEFGMALLADIGRHDLEELERLLDRIAVPVLAVQSTHITADGQRHPLQDGQTSPYLDLLRERVQDLTVEIVTGSGHYPQVEQPGRVNAAIAGFLASMR